MSKLLVTGFGAFGRFETNPSRILAETSGEDFEILEVSYGFVRQWIARLDPTRFDSLLLLGVNGGASRMHLETIGHNRICRTPDVQGQIPRCRKIHKEGPWRLRSSLWNGMKPIVKREPELAFSADAGGYLCNFSLYEALFRFGDKKVGFLHVPTFDEIDQGSQQELLRVIVEHIR